MHHRLLMVLLPLLLLIGCATPGGGGPEVEARNRQIAQEPLGDYWIGRRVAGMHTRFWGYIRRPRETWDKAQLVVFNEREKLAPDRLPELPPPGQKGFRYDNNREYRLKGYLTGRMVYDPNSNQILPEFMLKDYEEINASPGFLFHPREKKDAFGIPRPPR